MSYIDRETDEGFVSMGGYPCRPSPLPDEICGLDDQAIVLGVIDPLPSRRGMYFAYFVRIQVIQTLTRQGFQLWRLRLNC